MPFENPFLLREYRQVVRRPGVVFLGLLAAVGAPAFVFLLIYFLVPAGIRFHPSHLTFMWLIAVPHMAVCTAAGGYGADRIFGEEHRRSTLESLRLAYFPPLVWLGLRVCFALALVLLAWVAALPIYLLAAIARFAPTETLFAVASIPPIGGLIAIPTILLLPPDYTERMRQAQLRAGTGMQKADPDLTLRWLVLSMFGVLIQLALVYRLIQAPRAFRPFFGWSVPGWMVLSIAVIGLMIAATATAVATLREDSDSERRAFKVRLVLASLLYYLILGLMQGASWSTLPDWGRWLPIAIYPVFVLYLLRLRTRPREDRLSVGEVRWMASICPNPVMEKDLRVYLRFTSIRRYVLMEVLTLAAMMLGALYLFVVRGSAGVLDTLFGVSIMVAVVGVIVFMVEMAARPYAVWTRERTANTLLLLFLTPLTSREILWGRLVGGLTYTLHAHLPMLVIGTIGVTWATWRGAWMVPPVLVALCPILGLFAVVLASTVRPQIGPPWTWRLDEWLEVIVSIGQVVLLFAFIIKLAQSFPNEFAVWVWACVSFLINSALVWCCYLIRVRQFESLRRGEREVPLR